MTRTATMRPLALLWFALSLAVIAYATRAGLLLAPVDEAQGNIFRILYYHVPTSMLSLIFPYINFIASCFYLYWRRRDPLKALTADAWALASAEVTIIYASICLLTGMIWAKPVWGIWWTWDERLTSMLLLWLIYVSYLTLRKFSSTGQSHTLAAVLSVFAAVDVPIVYMSIRWWRTQHPSPIFFGGDGAGMDKTMLPAFGWNLLAWAMWGIFLLGFRYALETRRQADEQDAMLRAIDPWT